MFSVKEKIKRISCKDPQFKCDLQRVNSSASMPRWQPSKRLWTSTVGAVPRLNSASTVGNSLRSCVAYERGAWATLGRWVERSLWTKQNSFTAWGKDGRMQPMCVLSIPLATLLIIRTVPLDSLFWRPSPYLSTYSRCPAWISPCRNLIVFDVPCAVLHGLLPHQHQPVTFSVPLACPTFP